MDIFTFDWATVGDVALRLSLAFLLAAPIGWERERHTRLMGLRTFPIVAMASCAYILVLREIAGDEPQAQARMLQGLVTGMGFIGGGAILKGKEHVTGTATAASLWATGALGAAVAYGLLSIAIVVSLVVFLTLKLLTPIGEFLAAKGDE